MTADEELLMSTIAQVRCDPRVNEYTTQQSLAGANEVWDCAWRSGDLLPPWILSDYEECIGAKKHLVTGVSPHIGSRANSFATG